MKLHLYIGTILLCLSAMFLDGIAQNDDSMSKLIINLWEQATLSTAMTELAHFCFFMQREDMLIKHFLVKAFLLLLMSNE